jgi:hypothetical protein
MGMIKKCGVQRHSPLFASHVLPLSLAALSASFCFMRATRPRDFRFFCSSITCHDDAVVALDQLDGGEVYDCGASPRFRCRNLGISKPLHMWSPHHALHLQLSNVAALPISASAHSC